MKINKCLNSCTVGGIHIFLLSQIYLLCFCSLKCVILIIFVNPTPYPPTPTLSIVYLLNACHNTSLSSSKWSTLYMYSVMFYTYHDHQDHHHHHHHRYYLNCTHLLYCAIHIGESPLSIASSIAFVHLSDRSIHTIRVSHLSLCVRVCVYIYM